MSTEPSYPYPSPVPRPTATEPEWVDVVLAELAPEEPPPPRPLRWRTPLFLFLATCLSTWLVGSSGAGSMLDGLVYSASVMTILVLHEAGHFIQARRYGVYASLPYFLPVPLPPIGTMGAVIGMDAHVPHRKALFDIGISGPLAGLVPTLLLAVVGLHYSTVAPIPPGAHLLGDPLLMKFLTRLICGPIPEGHDVLVSPMAMASWVGLLITSLNLFPIGQLDGGHVLYSLLRRRAHAVAVFLLRAAVVSMFIAGIWFRRFEVFNWLLMVVLLFVMGPRHPPTADDDAPLGVLRTVLGWLTLAFLFVGFTPIPWPRQ